MVATSKLSIVVTLSAAVGLAVSPRLARAARSESPSFGGTEDDFSGPADPGSSPDAQRRPLTATEGQPDRDLGNAEPLPRREPELPVEGVDRPHAPAGRIGRLMLALGTLKYAAIVLLWTRNVRRREQPRARIFGFRSLRRHARPDLATSTCP